MIVKNKRHKQNLYKELQKQLYTIQEELQQVPNDAKLTLKRNEILHQMDVMEYNLGINQIYSSNEKSF